MMKRLTAILLVLFPLATAGQNIVTDFAKSLSGLRHIRLQLFRERAGSSQRVG